MNAFAGPHKIILNFVVIGLLILLLSCSESSRNNYDHETKLGSVRASFYGCYQRISVLMHFIEQKDSLSTYIPKDIYSYIGNDSSNVISIQTDSLGRLVEGKIPIGFYNVYIRPMPIGKLYYGDSMIASDITPKCDEFWVTGFRVARDSISILSEEILHPMIPFLDFPRIKRWKPMIIKI